ncbi:ABC transporter substrate-binding protein [Aeromicrobium senzhongii]|uniref:ABC transporter substrate-binding protein n=1 Tax=Aeromicrobium senzhongii TaxID=2663859 RepID=A0ABX6SWE7_9ACTN|nr:ABC transporter substrate-binding protein [Aeromicrobium senzhongii]MTB87644.1 ABC transporter substrate-binding protein [Aeromicrobium senzhongii]QNL95321.1 ABC transporter substrate-binding protein [Aeromicrobium senzhongii]
MNHPRSHRSTRTLVVAATVALAAAGLTACGSAGADSEGEETTIRYQSYAGAVDAFLLADALGEFEGLTLKRVGDVTGGPQALQALVSNQTDIGGSAFYGAIAQLVATGAPIKAVIPFYGSNRTTNSQVVVLDDSSIKGAKDLIGKKVAVNTLGANSEAVLDTWFDQEGLSQAQQDEITLVPLPPLNTPEALGNGKVDAAVVSFQSKQQTAKQYRIRALVSDVEVVGEPYAGGGLTLREEFIEKNPRTSRQIVEGVAAAIEFIETHEKQEIFDVYFPYLEKEGYGDYIEPIRTNFPGTLGIDAKPTIADEDIQRWVDWLDSRGDIDAKDIDVSDVYTNELNPNA